MIPALPASVSRLRKLVSGFSAPALQRGFAQVPCVDLINLLASFPEDPDPSSPAWDTEDYRRWRTSVQAKGEEAA
jgi:hypothetical protein